jgi:hypothetical protein
VLSIRSRLLTDRYALLLLPGRWSRPTGSLRAPSLPVGLTRSCEIYCPRIRDEISRHPSVATSASLYAFSFSFFFPFFLAVVQRLIVASFARSARRAAVPPLRPFVDPVQGERSSGCCFRRRSSAGGGSPWGPFVWSVLLPYTDINDSFSADIIGTN